MSDTECKSKSFKVKDITKTNSGKHENMHAYFSNGLISVTKIKAINVDLKYQHISSRNKNNIR